MPSRHVHIELEPWVMLHPLLRSAVWRELKAVCGVANINDMEVISLHTFEEWMLPREQSLVKRTRKKGQSDVPSTQTHKRLHPATD